MSLMLNFLSGPEKGREYLLPEGQDVIMGRADTGEFLVDDFRISKKEVVLSSVGDFVRIKDVGAEKGVVVNGERVTEKQLKEGDRIRVGGVMLVLVAVSRFSETYQTAVFKKPDTDRLKPASPVKTPDASGMIQGSVKEIPLAEILQFLGNARKSGLLRVESGGQIGRIYLQDGDAVFASIDDNRKVHPQKSLFRLLRWQEGTFQLMPPEKLEGVREMAGATSGVLLDGVQQADEMEREAKGFPQASQRLRLQIPSPVAFRALSPDELDVAQLVLEHGTVGGVLDYFPVQSPDVFVSDLDIYRVLMGLLERGVVVRV